MTALITKRGHMKEIAPTMPGTLTKPSRFIKTCWDSLQSSTTQRFSLCCRKKGGKSGYSERASPGTGNCYIWVKDIRNIYGELCDKGISFEDDIAARDEYDLTDFAIHDLDGNYICIGGEE